MTSKTMDIGSIDLISNLPDALVGHILSFLTTKEVALTSVLSKRWRYMLALVPNLDLYDGIRDMDLLNDEKRRKKRTSFQLFVDRVMALQGNASVNKFYLRCEVDVKLSSVNRWIINVLERGVVDLDLCVTLAYYGYPLPSEVLMSRTLVKLKVEGTCDFSIEVGEVFLPKLKTLVLDGVKFDKSGPALAKLISGCPVLEVLVITNVRFTSWEYFVVSNPSLKRLEVCIDDSEPESVSFDTPNVVYLQYLGVVADKYPKMNFESLVETRLRLEQSMRCFLNESAEESITAMDLMMGVCNVETLYLSGATLAVLASCCKAIPIFTNLIHLTILRWKTLGWETLQKLLENCPNLETLVFEGLFDKYTNHCKPWEVTRTCLSSSPVKMLKVKRFGKISRWNMAKQKEVIKYFLETMPNLEQMMIYYDTSVDEDPSILSSELEMLEKVASRNCKIQVISANISGSCTSALRS